MLRVVAVLFIVPLSLLTLYDSIPLSHAAACGSYFAQASSSVMQRALQSSLDRRNACAKPRFPLSRKRPCAPLHTSPYLSLYQPGHAWATTVSLVMIIVPSASTITIDAHRLVGRSRSTVKPAMADRCYCQFHGTACGHIEAQYLMCWRLVLTSRSCSCFRHCLCAK